MNFKTLMAAGTLIGAVTLGPSSFGCIGRAISVEEEVSLKNHIIFKSLDQNSLELEKATSLDVDGFPAQYGTRGDCGALWLGVVVRAQFGDPRCTTEISYNEQRWSSGRITGPRISRAQTICR